MVVLLRGCEGWGGPYFSNLFGDRVVEGGGQGQEETGPTKEERVKAMGILKCLYLSLSVLDKRKHKAQSTQAEELAWCFGIRALFGPKS